MYVYRSNIDPAEVGLLPLDIYHRLLALVPCDLALSINLHGRRR